MRVAVVSVLALLAAGCGAVQRDRPSTPSTRAVAPVRLSSPQAQATRTQWYTALKQTQAGDTQPALTESDVARGVRAGTAALGASVVAIHFLPLLGGSADVVVEPDDPVSFAEHPGARATTLLGPLGRDGHAYLVTIVDSSGQPLFMLGWVPEAGPGARSGEGIAWQAPGIRSDAIYGQPVTSEGRGSAVSSRSAAPGSTR